MEMIVGVNADCENYKIVDLDSGRDLSKFCWAADDEAGLYVLFNNDGEHIISTVASTDDEPVPYGERYVEVFTCEGNIKIEKLA